MGPVTESMDSNEDKSTGFFSKLKESVDIAKQGWAAGAIEGTDFEWEDIEEMADASKGDSVSANRIARIVSHLDADEQPHYFTKSTAYYGLKIEGGEKTVRKGVKGSFPGLNTINQSKGTLLVASNKRLIFITLLKTGDNVHTIPYDSITGIDTGGVMNPKITVQTHGRTYHMDITREKDDISEVIGYIRTMREKANVSSQERKEDQDQLSKLDKLDELRKKGVLTEEEFESKKKEILDGI